MSYFDTHIELPIRAHYDTSPPEPDVNWAGGLEIHSVTKGGEEVMHLLTSEEIEELARDAEEYERGLAESYDESRADYLEDRRRFG